MGASTGSEVGRRDARAAVRKDAVAPGFIKFLIALGIVEEAHNGGGGGGTGAGGGSIRDALSCSAN